jgi:hypothetical protein
MPGYEGVTEARLCVSYRGQVLRACKFAVSKADGSIYLFPYGTSGAYFFGRLSIPAGERSATVPFDQQETSASVPKISIHESGQVHIKADDAIAGPMFASPLSDLRGEHIATVTCVRFSDLARLGGAPKASAPRPDIVIPVEEGVESGRLVFYANAVEPAFVDPCGIRARLLRPTLPRPLFVGIRSLAQRELSREQDARGVTAIAGWDPRNPPAASAPADHLYVVAK